MTIPRSVAVRAWQVGTVVLVVAALEAISATGLVRPTVLPAPHDAVAALGPSLLDGTLWSNTAITLGRVLAAFMVGAVVGIGLGFLLWRLPRTATRSIEPLLASAYAIPWIAFYPALLVVFGLGDTPVILIASILSAVPVALNTFIGLAGLKPAWLAVAKVNRTPLVDRLTKVVLPGAAPHIVSGLKLGFIYAYLGVIGTEYLRSTEGLGYLVNTSYYFFQTTAMYGYVLIVLVIAVFVTLALTAFEKTVGGRFR